MSLTWLVSLSLSRDIKMLTSLTAAYPVPDFGKKSLDIQLYESPADQIRLGSLNLT